MTLPASYREQRACANCALAFAHQEYDCGIQYYCTLRAPPRPRCGSVAMGETFANANFEDAELFESDMNAWDEWSDGREVEPHGTCDEHEART